MEDGGGGGGGGGERSRRNGPNIDLAFFLSLDRDYRCIRVRRYVWGSSFPRCPRSSLFVIQAVAVPSAVEYQTTWITRSPAALRWER